MSLAKDTLRARAVMSFSHSGSRSSQEDYALVDREKGVFVIADGFGGPIPGAEASKQACEAVRSFLFKEAGDLDATLPFVLRTYFSLAGNVLFNSLIYANRKLSAINHKKNVHEKGGASVLAGFIDGDLLAVANVGVCSAWLLRNGKAVELVVPRSYGRLLDPFAVEIPESHRVPLIALGIAEDLEPEIIEYKIQAGDWVILNTDGISEDQQKGWIQQMAVLQLKNQEPDLTVKEVTQYFESQKYQDNASISLVIL
jgi:serine/threonine protein phosphatase PrpC